VGAVRTSGELGLDTTEEAQQAVTKAIEVRNELEALKSQLNEDEARNRADKLEAKLKEFISKNSLE
jgi:hypothetical protein